MNDIKRANVSRYPAYKQSGIPGIEDIPEHWDVVQLGRIGKFSKGSGGTKEDEVPSGIPCVRYGDIYTTHKHFITQTRSFLIPEKATEYTRIRKGDVLFPTSGETIEEIGKSVVNLMDSPVYCGGDLIIFRSTTPVEPRFTGYALDCPHSQDQKSRMGRGVSIMHIYSNQLKYLWLALPPLSEQAAIVRYLDDADQRIRAYVSAKERLIALLEEERQAVIHQAVTRGLDPNAKLKPSGVEWLGDVPEHWEIERLRNSVDNQVNGVWGDDPDGINDLPCIRVADFDRKKWRVRTNKLTWRSVKPTERSGRILKKGDLLLEKSGGGEQQPVGALMLYDHDFQAVCSNFVGRIVPRSGYDSTFLTYLHATLYAIGVNKRSIKQTTGIQNIDGSSYLSESVGMPPAAEQIAIAHFLERTTEEVDATIDRARRQIELMEEYRTRLIADVVTGKIDVSRS